MVLFWKIEDIFLCSIILVGLPSPDSRLYFNLCEAIASKVMVFLDLFLRNTVEQFKYQDTSMDPTQARFWSVQGFKGNL